MPGKEVTLEVKIHTKCFFVKVDTSLTCLDFLQTNAEKFGYSNPSSLCINFPSVIDKTGLSCWLTHSEPLSAVPLKDGDVLVVKQLPKGLNIVRSDGTNDWVRSFDVNTKQKISIKFDFTDCPSDLVTILKGLGTAGGLIQKDVQYVMTCLLTLGGSKTSFFLNNNVSLSEQNVPEDAFIALHPFSQLQKLTAEQLAMKSPELCGYLDKRSIKGARSTPAKRRWSVLYGHYFYYFKAPQGSASGIVPLESYGAYVDPDDPLAMRLVDAGVKGGSFLKAQDAKPTFVLKFESEKQFTGWYPKIARHCANYAANSVFGVSLSALMARKASWFTPIPEIAVKTFAYLKHEMEAEGLFRLSGSSSQVAHYKCMWETGITIDYEKEKPDPHTVASLFKMWLREMPNPLLISEKYAEFIQLVKKSDDEKLSLIPRMIAGLPVANKNLVKELIRFCSLVSEKSNVNKMTPNNLAIVFGPNLLQNSEENMMNMASDSSSVASITEFMIANASTILPLLDSKPRHLTNAPAPSPPAPIPAPVPAPVPIPSSPVHPAFTSSHSVELPGASARRKPSIPLKRSTGSPLSNSGSFPPPLPSPLPGPPVPLPLPISEGDVKEALRRLEEQVNKRKELEKRLEVLERILMA